MINNQNTDPTLDGFHALHASYDSLSEQLTDLGVEPAVDKPKSGIFSTATFKAVEGACKRLSDQIRGLGHEPVAAMMVNPQAAAAVQRTVAPSSTNAPAGRLPKWYLDEQAEKERKTARALELRAQYCAIHDNNARAQFWSEHRDEMLT